MGRAARFTREDLLLAAAAEAAMGRPVTIQALAAASGATVASISPPPTTQRPSRHLCTTTCRHESYYVLYSSMAIFYEGYVPIQCNVSGSEVVFTRTTAGRTS